MHRKLQSNVASSHHALVWNCVIPKFLGNQWRKAAEGNVHSVSAKAWFIGAADSRICLEYLVPSLGILDEYCGYSGDTPEAWCSAAVRLNASIVFWEEWRAVRRRCGLKWPYCSAAKLLLSNLFQCNKKVRVKLLCLFCLAPSSSSLPSSFFFLPCPYITFFPGCMVTYPPFVYCIPTGNGITHFSLKCVTSKEHEAVFVCEGF